MFLVGATHVSPLPIQWIFVIGFPIDGIRFDVPVDFIPFLFIANYVFVIVSLPDVLFSDIRVTADLNERTIAPKEPGFTFCFCRGTACCAPTDLNDLFS